MHEGVREATGFLCRWCLLGLACAIALAVAVAGVLAAGAVSATIGLGLVVPDAVVRATSGKVNVVGYATPPWSYGGFLQVICDNGQGITAADVYEGKFYPLLLNARPGRNSVHVAGMPYTCLSFRSERPILLCVPQDEPVYLLDARWAMNLPPEDSGALGELLQTMRRSGEEAFFHPGDLGEFVRLRERSRAGFPDIPLLCSVSSKGPDIMHTLNDAAWALGRQGGRSLHVVTADAELALAAARDPRKLFFVHFVGPDDARFHPEQGLRVYESARKLKEFLPAEPMKK